MQIKSPRAILIGIINRHQNEKKIAEFLDELSFLTETAGMLPVKRFTQHLSKPDAHTFIGKGKTEEIQSYIHGNHIDLVIFDDEISPSQQRNLEKYFERRVMDRTGLILEIFAQRAKTSYAKTQVELAQYQYLLPRLAGMWTHLERQRGGKGTRGGAGEKEIETDRRIVRKKIAALKVQLSDIDKQMAVQRKNRGEWIRVAMVGYTNVGKSTLMNLLAKENLSAYGGLFATLDTTVRKVVMDRVPFLLSDTVGFIRKLPHQLVESFKSTLDEVREADILLHIADISHPLFEEQIKEVKKTLIEIGAGEKEMITVFNKIDILPQTEDEIHKLFFHREEEVADPVGEELLSKKFEHNGEKNERFSLEQLKKSWLTKEFLPCVFVSAVTGENIMELKELLFYMVKKKHLERYPHHLPF